MQVTYVCISQSETQTLHSTLSGLPGKVSDWLTTNEKPRCWNLGGCSKGASVTI